MKNEHTWTEIKKNIYLNSMKKKKTKQEFNFYYKIKTNKIL